MKVAFWDGNHSCGDVTAMIAAISAFCAMNYERKVLLGSNHMSGRTLEEYYFGSMIKSGRERISHDLFYGEPEYFRQLWENRRTDMEVLTMEGVHLLPLPDILERRMFYHEEQRETLYFMDVSGGMNASVRAALEEADKVVVFLPQDIVEIRKFFNLYSSIIPKAIFLILDYRADRKGDVPYLGRNFGILPDRAGIIPRCEDFRHAGELGEVENFIRDHLTITKEHENFSFMQGIERATELILGFRKEKKEYELSK